jgi:hypothetical protein
MERTMISVGISVQARTEPNVLLRTLDVHQIRRSLLGKRKAPGMKSHCIILVNEEHNGQTSRKCPAVHRGSG